MKILLIISAILVLILGILTSYSDIKYKKAFNRQIVIFFVLGLCVQGCSIILDPSIWRSAILNCALTLGISITFYALRVWAAGDSKLFITMILLIPYPLYMVEDGVFFPAFFVMEFVFTLAVLYVLIESIVLFCVDHKEKNPIQLKFSLLNFSKETVISWVAAFLLVDTCDLLLSHYANRVLAENMYLLVLVNVLLVVAVLSILNKAMTRVWFSCVLLAIRIALSLWLGGAFSKITPWTLLIVSVTMIIRKFTSQYNYRTIPVSKLEVGNVLARASLIFMIPSAVKGLPKFTDETTRCRLNEEEVNAIKRWETSKYGKSTVTIVRMIPFAPFIFGGTLLYFIYRIFLGA